MKSYSNGIAVRGVTEGVRRALTRGCASHEVTLRYSNAGVADGLASVRMIKGMVRGGMREYLVAVRDLSGNPSYSRARAVTRVLVDGKAESVAEMLRGAMEDAFGRAESLRLIGIC